MPNQQEKKKDHQYIKSVVLPGFESAIIIKKIFWAFGNDLTEANAPLLPPPSSPSYK